MRRRLFNTVADAQSATPFFISEEGVGIWLGTDEESVLAGGQTVVITRDALHVPSLTRTGQPVPSIVRAEALKRAERLGLRERHTATGYWTLSETGALQEEAVIIVFGDATLDRHGLEALAHWLLVAADQDAVALEVEGRVWHLRREA